MRAQGSRWRTAAIVLAATFAVILVAGAVSGMLWPGWAVPGVRRAITTCAELGGVWRGTAEPLGPGCFRTTVIVERIPLGDAEYAP